MLKKISRFFREYKQFAAVIVTFITGIALDLGGQDTVAHWIFAISAILNTFPLLREMYRDLQTGKYGIDILAATAIVTSVILGEYYAAMIIVLMLTGGEALEDYAENRAKVELDALLRRAPKKAHVLRGRKEIDITISQVVIGDKLIIKPGELVPVDGTILEGRTTIDESSLTGESLPIDKNPGDTLMSGAVNLDGVLTLRAEQTADNSQYQQIIKLVKNAASTESPFVRLTDRYSIPFTIVSFGIAGFVWFISGDPMRFLQVIVVATPCPLLLAAPIALISGMSRSAKHGIIVKSGSALERLAEVRTVAFDKTGTLTMGMPEIDKIEVFAPFKRDEVLGLAASLEQKSTHVLAKAIVGAAEKRKLSLPHVKSLHEKPGRGLAAKTGSKSVLVGKLDYLAEESIGMPKGFSPRAIKTTATFVAINGSLAGYITFKDELREDTPRMLQRLKRLGIRHTLMVTGDNAAAAQKIAKKLGIEQVVSNALPGDKIRAVEALTHRPVAFVGDGVNDAPVLTASDIGIALGARGSTAASESADVVILTDDINQVAKIVEIAKRTFSIARQAIVIGIGMSIVLQIIFASGRFAPSLGAALQEVIDVAVILIALRAHGSFRQPSPKLKLQQA